MTEASRFRQATRVGFDVGGTSITAGAVVDGELTSRIRHLTPSTSDALLEAIGGIYYDLDVPDRTPLGVGVPGVVDSIHGRVSDARNLGIGPEGLDLGRLLEEQIGAPAWVANDVNVAAVGVVSALGPDDSAAVFINVGTGLGAAVVLGGEVWAGSSGLAGEIGLSATPGGGNLEDVVAAGLNDDVRDAVSVLAGIIELVVLLVDPTRVYVGGGVVDNNPALVTEVVAEMRRLAERSPQIRDRSLWERVIPVHDSARFAVVAAAGRSLRVRPLNAISGISSHSDRTSRR